MAINAAWCAPGVPPPPPSPPKQIAPPLASSLRSLGWRPLLITGLLRDLLIRHFATPLNIEEPDLRHLIWREDERTRILIESIHRWRGDLVEKRPAIIVKRNSYRSMRLGLGDRVRVDERGHQSYTLVWIGSHTLFCIHTTGAGVEILATEVQRELTQFAPAIIEYLGLLKWAVLEVGAIAEIEEAKEGFVIPINIGWAYQESWVLELESLKLRKIPLTTLLQG